jgi:hypothetical protein
MNAHSVGRGIEPQPVDPPEPAQCPACHEEALMLDDDLTARCRDCGYQEEYAS